jgi:hypothetical protein
MLNNFPKTAQLVQLGPTRPPGLVPNCPIRFCLIDIILHKYLTNYTDVFPREYYSTQYETQ